MKTFIFTPERLEFNASEAKLKDVVSVESWLKQWTPPNNFKSFVSNGKNEDDIYKKATKHFSKEMAKSLSYHHFNSITVDMFTLIVYTTEVTNNTFWKNGDCEESLLLLNL